MYLSPFLDNINFVLLNDRLRKVYVLFPHPVISHQRHLFAHAEFGLAICTRHMYMRWLVVTREKRKPNKRNISGIAISFLISFILQSVGNNSYTCNP